MKNKHGKERGLYLDPDYTFDTFIAVKSNRAAYRNNFVQHTLYEVIRWSRVPDQEAYENAFKAQWELFLKHVVCNTPFPWNLKEGAKGVQLAEKGMESWQTRRWIDIPDL